jgi:hypothetical protein
MAGVHLLPRTGGDKLTMARRLLVRRGGDVAGPAAEVRAGLAALDAEGR